MISFVSYGFGKVGYVNYNYTITEDNKVIIKMHITKEIEGVETPTIEVKLNKEEVKLVDHFRELLQKQVGKKAIGQEEEEKYEDSEIHYQGEIIKDEELLSRFSILRSLIAANHSELASCEIAEAYDAACEELYGHGAK